VGGHHARMNPVQGRAEPFVDKVWSEPVYGEHLFPFAPHTRHLFARGDMQYFTSRGCPYACTFCALRSPWKPKEIGALDYELKTLHDAFGFKEISFSDPNIGFGVWKDDDGRTERMDRVQRIRDIGRVMRDIGVKWTSNIRSPYLSPEMVDALVESNCAKLEIGCDSGNDWFLRRVILKGHGVDAIRRAALNVRGSGISLLYSFIARMPRETEAMFHDTCDLIDWIVDTDPAARVSIYNYAPFPGSPMYDDAVAGAEGYPRFDPPQTMEGWGELRLMASPVYWIVGLNFRMDNTRRNFPGDDWALIEPYVERAQRQWRARELDEFPVEAVESLVAAQVERHIVESSTFLRESSV
jgi:anaerobic magnesium-protoporphyrin IX monomethyl ester cyclase